MASASSRADGPSERTFILIVTPTYNSEQFLDDTILSVVSQSGDFDLRYHIQDGGSSDATLKIVRRWERLLRSGDFPILCASLVFSFDSRPDAGMYQAINRGVAQARPGRPFLMGWINSDDRLAPGALAAVRGIYDQFADVRFTCARVSMIDQHGVITGVNLPVVYDRQKLSEGAHDGRSHSFVMQEGTFWRSGLWDEVGGLDELFRLAGDWDLWRRFARHAALYTIDSVLGFHRRHAKQLSADLEVYHAEIDAVHQPSSGSDFPVSSEAGETLKFNLDSKRWERTRRRGTLLGTPIVHYDREGAAATCRVEVTSGARCPEGPYPEVNLPGGMRWIDDARAEAVVTVPYPGLWRMHLRIRNWRPDLRLLIVRGTTVCLDVMPGAGEDDRDTLLFASLWLAGGRNEIRIDSEGQLGSTPSWLFILLEWYVLAPIASDRASLATQNYDGKLVAATSWPAISVVLGVSDRGRGLDLRLDAILAQGYPDIDLYVVDDDLSEVNRQILAAYTPFIDRVVTVEGDHNHTAIGRAIDLARGVLIAVLDDTATLAPGALFALAGAVRQDEVLDLIVGITVDESGSTPITRRLPCLADGRLSLPDLLRVGRQAEGMSVFDLGALFFTRRIWQAAGGNLMAASPACAAFDFWVCCATIGATLRTLPVDLTHHSMAGNSPDLNEVRSHAEALAREAGLALGQEITTRPALKILLLDGDGIVDRPSDGCRRLATMLAAANQRVICLVDDLPDGAKPSGSAEMIVQAITSERPELVVVYGDRLSESCLKVVAQLVATNIPMIHVRERRARARTEAPHGADPAGSREASGIDWSLPGDWAVARPYGVLVYGRAGPCPEPKQPVTGHKQALHGLRACVDLAVYQPNRRTSARRILGLPVDAFIVLAVADHPTILLPSLAVTIEAYGKLECDAKLLMISGYTGELPPIDAAIVRVENHDTEDVQALYYAAADAVVSPLGEDSELPLVQAAASGTPTIVEGGDRRRGAIREGPFGLQLSAWTTPLLADGLRQLHADQKLHRRLSRSGLAHTHANHSLAAGAWSFMTLLGELHGFQRLHLARELHFPGRLSPFSLRPLQTARARPFLQPDWQVASSPPPRPDAAAGCTGIELSGEKTTVYLRARHGGPQRLRIHAASRDGALVVAVGVNGDDRATLEIFPRAGGYDSYFLDAYFFCGLNRIDLALAAPGASSAGLMLRSLDLEDLVIEAGKFPRWQPLIGFAEVNQTDGIGPPSHWLDGPSATLRLWSEVAGAQHLRLVLKNYAPPQPVEVAVNGVAISIFDAPTTDFLAPAKILVEVTVEKGWNLVSLTTYNIPCIPEFGRSLLILVSDIRFTANDDHSVLDEDVLSFDSLRVCGAATTAEVIEPSMAIA